jgi:citrate lyase beta subunit
MTQTTRPLTTAPRRSLLFCPAASARRVRKMLELAPDAAVLDLEDAVTDENKTAARQQARAGIAEIAAIRSYVRVSDGLDHSEGAASPRAPLGSRRRWTGRLSPSARQADSSQCADRPGGWAFAARCSCTPIRWL